MTHLPASTIRDAFADTINRVAYRGERIALERHGKTIAGLVSADDLALLQQLEDRMDLAAVRQALKSRTRHDWVKVKARLGL